MLWRALIRRSRRKWWGLWRRNVIRCDHVPAAVAEWLRDPATAKIIAEPGNALSLVESRRVLNKLAATLT